MTGLVGSVLSRREELEGDLTSLGNYLVYIDMLEMRLREIKRVTGMNNLIEPGIGDLRELRGRIEHHQRRKADNAVQLVCGDAE